MSKTFNKLIPNVDVVITTQKNISQIEKVFPKDKFAGEIEVITSKYCTLHNNELFYSYRKTGKSVKMNYSLIRLN